MKKLQLWTFALLLVPILFLPMRVATAQLKATLEGHTNNVWSVAFSPDGTMLASGSWDETVRLWDVNTKQLLYTLIGHTNHVNSIVFSPDGKTFVSSDWDGNIRLWDPHTGKFKRALNEHHGSVASVVFSPDGTTLASGHGDHTIGLWNTTTWQLERMLTGHASIVDTVAFSPDGQTLASGSRDKTIRLWDPHTGKHIKTFTLASEVKYLAFSPDGGTLASSSWDKTIRLWNPHTGELKTTLPSQTGWVNPVVFSPDGATLAIGGRGISLWDTETGQYLPIIDVAGDVLSVVFSPDGQTVASGSADNKVRLWEFIRGMPLNVGEPHTMRLIYFLARDRPVERDIDTKLDKLVKDVQQFYEVEMERHGFGRKTFMFETDATGKAVVHHVDGQFTGSYYVGDGNIDTMIGNVMSEIKEQFDISKNLYIVVVDVVRHREEQAADLHSLRLMGTVMTQEVTFSFFLHTSSHMPLD